MTTPDAPARDLLSDGTYVRRVPPAGEPPCDAQQTVLDRLARRGLYAVEAEIAILMGELVWDASQRRDHAGARA